MQQRVQLLGLHAQNGLFFGNHSLVHQIHGHLQSGRGGALAVAGLKHIELAVLDGELHVLHVAVVIFQVVRNLGELLVDLGHFVLQLADGRGSANAGHHVFALGIDEVLAEQSLFAGGGIAGECDARAGVISRVAEDHGLDVDSGAPVIGDLVHTTIDICPGIVPGTEHGLHGLHQLDLGVLREVLALFLLIKCLK
ncbi:hypothetical protein SDC9_73566 [bioreactor metagenome]|uniref:NAD-specific glutamate dehydrogenase n=1 Tax=bioreactor metagenome TaxID=1076179 RepID=A0A644YGP3_9ZZZZ